MKRLTSKSCSYNWVKDKQFQDIALKLQEYENAGLTPKEVELYVKCQVKLIDKELLKLRKENAELKSRIEKSVELPCKVGDILYDISEFIYRFDTPNMHIDKVNEITISTHNNGTVYFIINSNKYEYSNFGKTVFLTKEEAEQALKGGTDNE